MLSLTTDYAVDNGCPGPYLKRIAAAGFSHVHWCHHWNDDFLYDDVEIRRIAAWFAEYGLSLNDLHASSGQEKAWGSVREYERRAGVELVKNRIAMTAELGADVIIIHLADGIDPDDASDSAWTATLESLKELEPFARKEGVRIAVENGDFRVVEKVLAIHDGGYVGLCYDSGHGNMGGAGLDGLDRCKDRLIAIHLSDNDAGSDQHKLPFSGSVEWPRLARIIAQSSYTKCVNLETVIGEEVSCDDECLYVQKAFETAKTLSVMIVKERGRPSGNAPSA